MFMMQNYGYEYKIRIKQSMQIAKSHNAKHMTNTVSTDRLAAAISLDCVVVPQFPPIVKVLNDFGRVLDITLSDLLVGSKPADRSYALLQIAVDYSAHVTLSQLT